MVNNKHDVFLNWRVECWFVFVRCVRLFWWLRKVTFFVSFSISCLISRHIV